jgi:catechol 2,3-dioxygenase-like lactoylglutathione lyase family enzyme
MAIRTIDHINIATLRLEETRAFYVEVLGLTQGFRPPFPSDGYWLYADGHPVVHMQTSTAEIGPSQASALNHFAFDVTDLDAMLARLDAHQVPYEATCVPGSAIRQAFFLDPNGVRIELNFRPG